MPAHSTFVQQYITRGGSILRKRKETLCQHFPFANENHDCAWFVPLILSTGVTLNAAVSLKENCLPKRNALNSRVVAG